MEFVRVLQRVCPDPAPHHSWAAKQGGYMRNSMFYDNPSHIFSNLVSSMLLTVV